MAIVDKYISHITPLGSLDAYKLKAYLLKNGRTFKVQLNSTNASTTFDGSADIADIGVSGILGAANGGTGNNLFTKDTLIYANTATKLASYTFTNGGAKKLWYLNAGVPTDSAETVGATDKPVFLSSGTITESTSNIGSEIIPIYMASGQIKASTSTVGSGEWPVYLNSGTIAKTTYYLKSNIEDGSANQLAYYSAARTIDYTPKIYYINSLASTAEEPINMQGLRIVGSAVGNDSSSKKTTISGTTGLLSYGDGGPQIQFSTSEKLDDRTTSRAQSGALIFTDHDAAATGASWHFVSNQGDWNVISKRFHARTGISIGTSLPNTSYNLYVNGTSYFNGNTTHNGIDYFANGTTYYINNSGTGNLNALTVNNTTASTTTGTGGLIVKGGAGIAGRVTASEFNATRHMIINAGKVYSNISGSNVILPAKTTTLFADGIAIANPGLTAANDVGWLRVTGTAETDMALELATGDDGSAGETIHVRQYNTSNTIVNDLTLLDNQGNTLIPNSLRVSKGISKTEAQNKIHIVSPGGGSYATSTSKITGALKIQLPVSWTSCMLNFSVDIYDYATSRLVTYHIGGYNYSSSSQWVNTAAYSNGTGDKSNLTVRFGHDGTHCCVIIGETNTSWSYPQVNVRDVYLGYSNQTIKDWETGWVISFITTLPTITGTTITSPNRVLDGTESHLAYYKAAKTIGYTPNITFINGLAADVGTGKIYGLEISGAITGTAANLKAGEVGILQYGDAGPQLRFDSSGQKGAIIFTEYDNMSDSGGASFHFVTNQQSQGAAVRARYLTAGDNQTAGRIRIYQAGAYGDISANDKSNYGALKLTQEKGNYVGLLIGNSSDSLTIMDSGVSKGLYAQNTIGWLIYGHNTNKTVGIRTSSITSGYDIELGGTTHTSKLIHIDINGGTSLDNSRPLMIGPLTGINLAIGRNAIQARNNGAASILYLNYNAGSIQFGSSTSLTAPTKIFGTVTPGANWDAAAYNLGSTSLRWNQVHAKSYYIEDTRDEDLTAATSDKAIRFFFSNKNMPTSAYYSGIHVRGWTGAYSSWELVGPSDNTTDQRTTPLYLKTSNTNGAWGSWRAIALSNNTSAFILNQGTANRLAYYSAAGTISQTGSNLHTDGSNLYATGGHDFITAGNEFNFISDGFSSHLWFNYETVTRKNNGNVTAYIFGNGKRGELARITLGQFSGNAATATEFSSNATVTLTGDTTGTSTGSTKSWSVPTVTSAFTVKGGRVATADSAHAAADYSKMYLRIATDSMATNKPKFSIEGETAAVHDGHILEFHWDNSGAYNEQLALSNSKPAISVRAQPNGTWSAWTPVLTSINTKWVAWGAGTTAGPTAKLNIGGTTITSAAIPSASTGASGIVTTGAQSFAGIKTFTNPETINTTGNGAAINFKFSNAPSANAIYGQNWISLTNNGGRFYWREWGGTADGRTAGYEQYCLPACDAGRTTTVTYDIITTKNMSSLITGVKSTAAGTATNKCYILGQRAAGAGTVYIATENTSGSANKTGIYFQGSTGVLHGAAWNDYAEFRQLKENKMYATTVKPGRVVYENGDDTLSISNERLMRGCSIVSDTYGFGIGESEKAQLPIAVSGRVLAYPYENKEEFKTHIGWPVCSGPNGTVSIMTEKEEMKYPSRIIGTISAVPDYEIWHGGADVVVDGRVWIKVR